MSDQFFAGAPATIIANTLILRGGQLDWAKDTAETILDVLEIAGFKIVAKEDQRGEERIA